MFYKITVLSILLLTSTVQFSHATQTHFLRSFDNGTMKYDYTWHNLRHKKFNTSFNFYANDVQRSINEFKPYNEQELESITSKKIQEFIKRNSPYGLKVSYNPASEQLSFKSVSKRGLDNNKINRFMNRIEEEREQINLKYFKKHYYNYNPKNNTIRPAHGTIAKRYVVAMKPVAHALLEEVRGRSSREITNHVLNFIQSIPYDTLEDPRNSNGAGFQTPYGVIHGNKGDCDSKSVMFAAIMRNIYPYARIIVVYVPGHALVGFDYNKGKNDYALQIEATNFVFAEPVGPNKTVLGEVSPAALAVMRQGDYSYEEVPH